MGCSPCHSLEVFKPKETLYIEKIVQRMSNGKLQPLDHSALASVGDRDDLLAEANSLLRLHRVKEAKEYFKEIISKNLFITEDIVGLGCSEQQIGHYEHNFVQWYFQHRIKVTNPYDPLYFCYQITKEFQQAQQWIEKELSVHPEDYRLVLGLAHTYFNLKLYKEARQFYLKVINLKKDLDRPYQIIAVIYKLQNKEQQARLWAEKALEYNPENVYAHFMAALCENDLQSRIVKLKKVTKLNKSYGRPYNALGNAYKRVGNVDKAVQYYKKCIKLAPNYEAPYIGLGNIYRESKMYKAALEAFEKSIKINSSIDLAFTALANTYNEIENYQQAIQQYQEAIHINKDCYAAYYGMGVALRKTNKLTEARSHFEKALEISPDYVLALQGLVDAQFLLENFQRVKVLCSQLIQMHTTKGIIYYMLGQASYKLKDIEQSKLNFEKCAQIEPNFLENLCALGNVYYKLEQYDLALQYFNKCLEIEEKYEWAHYYMGKLFKKKGQLKQSEDHFNKCLKINGKNRYALTALANLLCEENRVNESIYLYNQSIQCYQNSFSSHYGLGNAFFMKNNYEASIAAYKKAIQLDQTNYQPYNGLGNCFKALNFYEQGLNFYQKALQLDPDNDVSYYGIGNTLNLQGNFTEAESFFLKALQRNDTNTLCKMNLGFLYLKMQNFKKAFQLISSARDNIDSDDRLTQENQQYLKQNIKIFQQQAEEWQVRSKMGFISEASKAHLNQIIDNFEEKVKFLYKSEQEGSKINKKRSLNPGIIKIINLIYDSKFKITEITNIFQEVHKLFFVDQDYFHILPQFFCQYFWSQKFIYNRLTTDIEKDLTELLKAFSGQIKKNNKGELQASQLSNSLNEEIRLTLFQNKREKINLFNDTDFFPSYQQLYSEIKAANTRAIKFLPQFKELVMSLKKSSKGFLEQVNLKLPENSKNEFKVMLRIMQKMFRQVRSKKNQLIKNIDTILDKMDNVTIDLVVHEIIGVWTEEINSTLQKRIEKKKPTPCYISDLVRGKIFFNKVGEIKGAIRKIQQYCLQKKYMILDCQNRLFKPQTQDVVLKIQIGEAVCELQLAIKTNLTTYHFDHCLYEILRSPLGCIFGSYLFMSKGFKYPFIQNCKDIGEQLKKKSSLKDRVIAKKVQYIIKTLQRQQIPFKQTKIKRTKSEEQLEHPFSSPVKKQMNKCNET